MHMLKKQRPFMHLPPIQNQEPHQPTWLKMDIGITPVLSVIEVVTTASAMADLCHFLTTGLAISMIR